MTVFVAVVLGIVGGIGLALVFRRIHTPYVPYVPSPPSRVDKARRAPDTWTWTFVVDKHRSVGGNDE